VSAETKNVTSSEERFDSDCSGVFENKQSDKKEKAKYRKNVVKR